MRKTFLAAALLTFSLLIAAPVLGQDVLELEDASKESIVETPEGEVQTDEKVVEPASPEHKKVAEDLGVETIAPTQEGTYLTWAVKAVKSKNWPLLAGLIIMLLLFLANKLGLKEKINKKYIPWIGVLISVLGSIGTMLITGILWYEAVIQGFLVGAAASGLWELLKNKLNKWLGKNEPKPKPEEIVAPAEEATEEPEEKATEESAETSEETPE